MRDAHVAQKREGTMNKLLIAGILVGVGLAGGAYATLTPDRVLVTFFAGHTHGPNGEAIGAPEHSGGTNSMGCQNGSVPYHWH